MGAVCSGQGRPSSSHRASGQAPQLERAPHFLENSTLHSVESSTPAPCVSRWSRGADATFCKQAFVFYSARILVPSVSTGHWKAAPKGQPAGISTNARVLAQ